MHDVLFQVPAGVFGSDAVDVTLWSGAGLPWWGSLFTTFLLTLGVGFGVVVGFHRILTHRACRLWRPLEVLVVFFGLPAGTPVQWIGNHRHHHAVSDTAKDAHSPRHHGFWTAHCGWYLETANTWPAVLYAFAGPLRVFIDGVWRPRSNQQHVHLARDIADDVIYGKVFSSKLGYLVCMSTLATVPLVVTWFLFGVVGLAYLVVWEVIFYTAGDFINSLGHASDAFALGTAPFKSNDESRNVGWLGWFAFGDGFHNAHHAFPRSARCGLLRGEVDVSWLFIHVCDRLGLAREVYTPPVDKIVDRLHDKSLVLARDLEKQRALPTPPVEEVPHAA